uniref:Cytochrome P450 n=1 Tax=Kalanchoe fedtschenkoi TaxID=63787 RepID=A0A7N0VEZ5_KALFE
MESTVNTATLTSVLLSILILTWAYRVINWLWLTPKRLERSLKRQGFKGGSYRILYGDMKENSKMTQEAISKPIGLSESIIPRLLPYVDQCLKIYGNNSIMWLGPKPRILLMEPELIKDIFNKISEFHKHKDNPLTRLLGKGVINYEDDKWAKHRKLINPAFHSEKIKNMMPAFYLSSAEMIEKWEKLVFDDDWCELDVWPDLQNMTRDVISRTAFGSSYEEGKRIFELQHQLTTLVTEVALSVYIPGWRFVPTKMNRRMKALNRDIVASLRAIINEKEKAMKEGKTARDDLLGLLIESNWRETKGNKNDKTAGMTVDEVIEECKLFYFAGQETTSTLLVWTMILLSQHQAWQERARDEVLQIFGLEKPHHDGLTHLKIVNMILHEVLRLYPPITIMNRETHENTKLGDLALPAGVIVSLPILSIHHDPKLWGDDANEFKPERFSEGVSKATKNQVTFMPFGWGPRICIGQNFALLEAKMAIALILQRFSFDLSPSYTHAPHALITLQPQHGAPLILHKR